MTKLNDQLVAEVLSRKQDPKTIYDLHMAQARDALKMFKGDDKATARITTIIAKIKQTYNDAIEQQELEASRKWPFPTTKRG